jgi:hypothetical protein
MTDGNEDTRSRAAAPGTRTVNVSEVVAVTPGELKVSR